MNIKNKKILIILIMAILTAMALPSRVNAGLQANKGGTRLVYTSQKQFFNGIRRMEMQNGTLGKSAVLDEKYLDTTENGIDCHMSLNTEFGTAAILSYSIYGKSISQVGDTTTGNESGIYEMGFSEQYVAGIYYGANSFFVTVADNRYCNFYGNSATNYGDANGWIVRGDTPGLVYPYIYRASQLPTTTSCTDMGAHSSRGSRATVVCGKGL